VDGLAAAHQLGVVHRDIKPENVLIAGRHSMVADFGVAKAVSEATGRPKLTKRGIALGTPSYMAPEQAAADETIDHRADIYAVGALGYELLVGWPPFHGRTPQQILTAQVMEKPQPVSNLRPSVPPALEALVMRCLEKKAADRWQSAEEMLPHLEAAATPSGGMTPTDMEPLATSVNRARRRWAGWAGFGVLAVAGLAAGYFGLNGPTDGTIGTGEAGVVALPEDYVAVFPFENLTGDPELDQMGTLAAYVVTDGFGWVDGLRAVATTTVAQAIQGRREDMGVLEVAEALGTGTAVTGIFTLTGATLEFRAEALRVATGELIGTVRSSGSSSEPSVIVEDLRARILGMLAMEVLQYSFAPALPSGSPKLEALRVHLEGLRTFWSGAYDAALPQFHRAHELDTTFLEPLAWALTANLNMGRWATGDSLMGILESHRGALNADLQVSFDWGRSRIRGDREGALRAARARARSDPNSTWLYLHGLAALHTSRPAEALQTLQQIKPESWATVGWTPGWEVTARAYYLNGRYLEARDVARQGREFFPEALGVRWHEIRSLIALDRLDEIQPLLDSVEVKEPGRGWTPGYVFRLTAADLARAGRVEEARVTADRAADWYQVRDPEGYDWSTAQALVQAGRVQEALALLEPMVLEHPDDIDVRGLNGVTRALAGDALAAEAEARWLEELDRPYLHGANTYWRAAILAHLGRKDESVRTLRQAFQEGHPRLGVPADPNLMPLWGFGPFERAIAPQG
jgi:tetratricopeptide (TPR) repeat protein